MRGKSPRNQLPVPQLHFKADRVAQECVTYNGAYCCSTSASRPTNRLNPRMAAACSRVRAEPPPLASRYRSFLTVQLLCGMWNHYSTLKQAFVMPKLRLYLGQAKLIDFSTDFSLTTTKLMPFEDWYWTKIVRYDEFCYSERLAFAGA